MDGRRSPEIPASSAEAARIAWRPWPMRRRAEAPPRHLMLTGVAPLQTAEPSEVSFLDNRKYVAALADTRAGAVIVHPDMADKVPPDRGRIVAPSPMSPGHGWRHCSIRCRRRVPASTRPPWWHPTPRSMRARRSGRSRDRCGGGDRRRAAASVPLAVIGDGVVLGARLPDRRARVAQPRADRRSCRHLSRRPHRPGRLWIRHRPARGSSASRSSAAW